ncbi:MAG TPA: hypothetical protein VG433_01575 [Pirellulales bacterium]|jgi:hypothetical protein|nr:hypothetical protein [Pirellulales bacterium]
MDPSRSQPPLQRFFAGLTEYTFETRLGLADPPLIDYIARMLAGFVHCDAIYNVRNPAGRRLREIGEMLLEAEARVGQPRREVHRHIGDFALFWTGLFPEALRRSRQHLDYFVDYCEQGKRAYYIASTIPEEESRAGENQVLERLSHDFDLCVYGLNEVRREWQRREGPEGPERPLIIN